MDLAIKTNQLSKHYNSVAALDKLDLAVPTGSIYGFLGPNGAGKTTTIRLLLGLLLPTAGEAVVLGKHPWRNGGELRQQIGYVAENNNLYSRMQLREIISFAKSIKSNWDEPLAKRLIECFQLPERQTVASLSRGMQRQLALTLALASRPRLLLLDEPTANLDPIKRKEFISLLLEQMVEHEQTILLSSHDLAEVERIADHVALLDQGRLLIESPLDDLKQQVRQITVLFEDSAPELPKTAAILSGISSHNRWELIINHPDALTELLPPNVKHVEERKLALLDIFMAYAGGNKHGA